MRLKYSLNFILILLIVLFLSANSFGVTISGVVYDNSLNKVDKAIVEVFPQNQRDITENGTYSFDVKPGNITIVAKFVVGTNTYIATEKLIVGEVDTVVFDLFLFDEVDEDFGLDIIDFNVSEEVGLIDTGVKASKGFAYENFLWLFILITVVMVVLVYFNYTRMNQVLLKSKAEDDDNSESDIASKIVNLLKENDGRMYQREIRQNIPYSESKVSLVLSELEGKGKIKRFKKGRGNVVSLVKWLVVLF